MNLKIAALLVVTFVAAGAIAQARPNVKASMTQSVVTHDANGQTILAPVSAAALKPGTVVRYTIVAVNDGTDPARDLKLAGKIPASTAFKTGSAVSSIAGAKTEFSIDGAKTWSASPMVRLATAQGVVERPAQISQYQAIRWNDSITVPANASATFTYEVTVK